MARIGSSTPAAGGPAQSAEAAQSTEAAKVLRRRHGPAVLDYARVCARDEKTAEDLAAMTLSRALHTLNGLGRIARRPRLLGLVLQIAADRADGDCRHELASGLADWLEDVVERGRGLDVDTLRGRSPVARAFQALPARKRVVLWQNEVEHDGEAQLSSLLGIAESSVARAAHAALAAWRAAYVRSYPERVGDDGCRRYSRLVDAAAYWSDASASAGLGGHVANCPHCSRALDDLTRMRQCPGELLAEAMLPWGAAPYLTARHNRQAEHRAQAVSGVAPRERTWRSAAWAAFAAVLVAGAGASIVDVFPWEDGGPSGGGQHRLPRPANSAATGTTATATATARPTPTAGKTPVPSTSPPRTHPSSPETSRDTPRPGHSVPSGNVPVLDWRFNESSDKPVLDSSKRGNAGRLVDGAQRVGRGDRVLILDGFRQYAEGPDEVVATDRSFTVSAWVFLDDPYRPQAAVSQDGHEISGFSLGYSPVGERWTMGMYPSDRARGHLDQALSRCPARPRTWVHLTGVHQDADNQLRL
ncbi:LamG-like jellyroll fold domain-containing protein [Wenjunlia tyrosinilytica]|uniref:Uncharacterized protein n=1 Tax=Wenjunlia tyrosinilytica TaxID=1544741 RepID=A0A917ZUW2_9ACTN|nr:LamG-like jellyroll fold domain-containing protein [Wenjunlia tyrosinilytica]GGO96464.1 hypothetical protein GCM10012280_56010 [Wenjunlia tyrosinilytica]